MRWRRVKMRMARNGFSGTYCMTQDCGGRDHFLRHHQQGDYRSVRDIAITSNGTNFILTTPDGQAEVAMSMVGRHNH